MDVYNRTTWYGTWSTARSATTLVSIRNTRLFRMALTALTEPRSLWRRTTCFPSPRRRVALHSISKMYFSHWKPPGVSERMWRVNLDASISGEYQTLGGDSCHNWERRRQAWEHLGAPATCLGAPRVTVMYSVCILIYVSMYLYNYPSTHAISGLAAVCWIYTPHHPVHLHYPCISVQSPSLLEDVLDRACLGCTWRRRWSELSDALGGRDRASLEMQLEGMIGRNCRP